MARLHLDERGSALVEAALVFPCLVLALWWSAALTDVLLLKLKAAEAARYALWESTVFKPPHRIARDLERRFADLASPREVTLRHTALLLAPRTDDLRWRAEVDDAGAEVSLGGSAQYGSGGPGGFAAAVAGTLPRAVDAAFRAMGFDTHGVALARVAVRARHGTASPILAGGDLPGLRGGDDLAAPRSLGNLTLEVPLRSQRPMGLVFDPWKAWPKPDPRSPGGVSPARTYPEVERQVSARLGRIAFFAAGRIPGFGDLRDLAALVTRSGLTRAAAGGALPDIFSTGRMDDPAAGRGPVTILPPERAAEPWVPHRCEIAGEEVDCPTQRLGDVLGAAADATVLEGDNALGGIDRARYTVPYRIRSAYWRRYGGMDRELETAELEPVPRKLSEENGYVRSYRCRGRFFGGSTRAQQPNRFGSCG